MVTETKTATVSKLQGVQLEQPIEFSYTFKKYETWSEAVSAGETLELDDDDKLTIKNRQLEAAARSKASSKAVKNVRKDIVESDEFKRENAIKALMSLGFSREDAESKVG